MNVRLPSHVLFLLVGLAVVPGAEAQFFRNFFNRVTTLIVNTTAGTLGVFGIDIGVDTVGPVCGRVVDLIMNNIPDDVIEVTGDITCTDCGLSAFAIGGGGNVELKCAPENEICVPFDGVEYCGTTDVELALDAFSIRGGIGSVVGGGCFTIIERDSAGDIIKTYKEICIDAGVNSLASVLDVSGGGLDLDALEISKCEISVGGEDCICTLCNDGGSEGTGVAANGVKVSCPGIDLDPTEEGSLFLPESDVCVGTGLVDRSGKSKDMKYVPFMVPIA